MRHRIFEWFAALVFGVMAILLLPSVGDAQSITVERIEVEGNYRVESEAILRAIETEVGEQITDRGLGDDIRAIYALGFFDDIQIDAEIGEDGIVLTYIVSERPAIAEIRYTGNDELGELDFEEVMDLRVGQILDENLVRANEVKIEDLYRRKATTSSRSATSSSRRTTGRSSSSIKSTSTRGFVSRASRSSETTR